MVSKKNMKLIEEMKEVLTKAGYKEDRYGNHVTADKTVRFKFNDTSYRKEVKIDRTWARVHSAYYKDVRVEDGRIKISKLIK